MVLIKKLRAGAAGLAVLLVAGCFDLEHDVTIKGDGSGSVRVALITDPVLGKDTDFESILESDDRDSEIREYSEDGKFIHEEIIRFDSLEDLTLQDEEMRVSAAPRMFWGLGPNQARFERTLYVDAKNSDEFRIMERVFLDHTYSFSVTLPGFVTGAAAVTANGKTIEPERSGATTTWVIPLADLAVSEPITFQADFIGYFGFETDQQTAMKRGGLLDLFGILPSE